MPQAKPKRRLKNLTVEFISLVDAGANKREVIYKNADANSLENNVAKTIEIRKVDDEQGLVYGIVYAPDESDAHDDTMLAADIKKAAHEFLAAGKTNRVDKQHDQNPDKGYVVESYIIGKADANFPSDPIGSWAVVIKVTDEATKKELKDGEIKGISMEGFAEVENLEDETPVEKAEFIISEVKKYIDEKFPSIKKLFKKGEEMNTTKQSVTDFAEILKSLAGKTEEEFIAIQKSFADSLVDNQLRQAVFALESSSYEIMRSDSISDKKAALVTNAGEFADYVSGLTISKSKTPKNEDTSMSEVTKEATDVEKSEGGDEKSPELQAIEKLTSTVTELGNRIEKVEKTAGISKANSGQDDGEHVEKSYSADAPLNIFG